MSTPAIAPTTDVVITVVRTIHLPQQVPDATMHVQIHTDAATFDAILAEYPGHGDVRMLPALDGLYAFRSVRLDLLGQPTTIFGSDKNDAGTFVEVVAS